MGRPVTLLIITLLLLSFGCEAATEPAIPPDGETTAIVQSEGSSDPNVILFVSDQPNAIDDFSELWVAVSGVGFAESGDEPARRFDFEPVELNLVPLQEENAIALWQGYVEEGTYNKVFLFVDSTHGELSNGETVDVKLPSNMLHVDAPLTLGDEDEGEATEYVFDLSVVEGGESGMYIIQPQLTGSGEGQPRQPLEPNDERVRRGPLEGVGAGTDDNG